MAISLSIALLRASEGWPSLSTIWLRASRRVRPRARGRQSQAHVSHTRDADLRWEIGWPDLREIADRPIALLSDS